MLNNGSGTLAESHSVPRFTTDQARYEAIRQRDVRADDVFLYSVATTGVYCRPSCGARLARPENVAFHTSPEQAERAGFRACKRCKPREPSRAVRQARLIAMLRALLESPGADVSLAALAERAQLSPFHLQRLFKQHVGMSPREYAAAHRLRHAEHALRRGSEVTRALYDAGYSSSGRFHEASGALGMKASSLRRGGAGARIAYAVRACTLGQVLLAESERGVCAIAFGDDRDALVQELQQRFPRAELRAAPLDALAARVVPAIDCANFPADLPLDLIGTAFQQRVWRELTKIPRGQTRSYAQLAEAVGAPRAVRAVGTACAQNPVAGLVPCHRVLRGDGQLGGYRWGIARKQELLERERDDQAPLKARE
jgi:AraC family transcriptional regulator, regulatory protein of adaptative response / methylated-DNA-[protein]-cysteine methyltransferase